MFTGLITATTPITRTLTTADGVVISFKKPSGWDDIEIGESIATNGACLTVSAMRADEYDCFLMPETLEKTALTANMPEAVNLERSLSVNDRFGGHFVQGHVDGTGEVTKIETTDGWRVHITFLAEHRELVIPKGSITINGVSLTVAEIVQNSLIVALIPHTLEATTLSSLKIGDKVNLEFDTIGKYIVNIINSRGDQTKIA